MSKTKSFKQFVKEEYLTEGKRTVATDFEAYITAAYNGGIKKKHARGLKETSDQAKARKEANEKILTDAKVPATGTNSYTTYEEPALKIAKFLHDKTSGAGALMTHEGTAKGTLSTLWKDKGGTNKTSKADNSIGDNIRLSLKNEESEGSNQLISAHEEETVCTFYAALKHMNKNKKHDGFEDIIDEIQKLETVKITDGLKGQGAVIGDLTKPINAEITKRNADVRDAIKKAKKDIRKKLKIKGTGRIPPEHWPGKKGEVEAAVIAGHEYNPNKKGQGVRLSRSKNIGTTKYGKKGKKQHTTKWGQGNRSNFTKEMQKIEKQYFDQGAMQRAATDKLNHFFANDPDFKKYFTFEAATGELKFSNDPPKANYMFQFKTTGEGSKLNHMSDGGKPTPYIEKMSSQLYTRMNWKTHDSSGGYATYPTLRGEIKPTALNKWLRNNDLPEVEMTNESYEYNNSSPMSRMISEEFASFSIEEEELFEEAAYEQQLINEGLLDWAKSKVKVLADKIKNFLLKTLKKVMDTMRKLLKKGIDVVLGFIGIKADKVEISGLTWKF